MVPSLSLRSDPPSCNRRVNKVVNPDWVNHQVCRLSQNIYIITNHFISNYCLFKCKENNFFLNVLYTKQSIDKVDCNIMRHLIYRYWPECYKTFFMLNSAEHGIFLLINIEMPTIVVILIFMSANNCCHFNIYEREK